MSVRHWRTAALAPPGSSAQPGHLGGGSCFVDKDQALRIEIRLRIEPDLPPHEHVWPVLLAGVRRFFLTVMAWRSRKRHTVLGATCKPWSRRSISASSTNVMST